MAGFPKAIMFDLISFVTTLPAPIRQFSFKVVPQTIVEFAPIETPSLTKVEIIFSSLQPSIFGYKSLVKVTPGPIKTFRSIVTPL